MTMQLEGKQRLEAFLKEAGVPFEEHEHALAYTAQAVAEAEHAPGKTVAKVVMAVADDELVMFVLPAPYRLDTAKAAAELAVDELRLAHENEFKDTFPDCDVGAMPPFGRLYGLDTYVDEALAADEYILFQAGTHTDTIRTKYSDFAKVARPTVVDVAHRG